MDVWREQRAVVERVVEVLGDLDEMFRHQRSSPIALGHKKMIRRLGSLGRREEFKRMRDRKKDGVT